MEEANQALVDSILSNSESGVDSDSDSYNADEVFSKLYRSDLITFCQDLMDRCQQSHAYEHYKEAIWSYKRWIKFL